MFDPIGIPEQQLDKRNYYELKFAVKRNSKIANFFKTVKKYFWNEKAAAKIDIGICIYARKYVEKRWSQYVSIFEEHDIFENY